MGRWDERAIVMALALLLVTACVMVVLLCGGCADDDACEPAILACDGTVLQECGADRSWSDLVDCAGVGWAGESWACCVGSDGDPTCLPVAECGDGR
jgi:hypothetical protein